MECTTDFFDSWLQTQEKIIENLRNLTEQKHFEAFCRSEEGVESEDESGHKHNYVCLEKMLEKAQKSSAENCKVINDSLTKSLNGSTIYSKLYALWKPFLISAQENTGSDKISVGFANLAEYKKILDMVFGFPSAQVDDSFEQLAKCVESFFPGQELVTPWINMGKTYSNMFPQFTCGDKQNDLEFLHTTMSVFTDTLGKFVPIPSVDATREKAESYMKGLECLTQYLLTTLKYRHIIYVTGQAAVEKIVSIVLERIDKGEESGTFDDFFDLWIEINENTFRDLFRTDEFSGIQNEMMGSYLRLKNHMSQQMELYLADYPIPVRSEMNDLYRIIYELKKKVNSLEKKLNEVGK